MRRSQSAKSRVIVPNACRILGVQNLKQNDKNGRVKLTTASSSSSDLSEKKIQDHQNNLEMLANHEFVKNFAYNSIGNPIVLQHK